MKAGFIGLGNLGSAMAKRLMAEGVSLTVWNRTPEKAAALGTHQAGNPSEVVTKNDVTFLNLFDSNAVKSVFTGKGGIAWADCSGKVIIDTSTNHPHQVLEFYEIIGQKGGYYMEAPILGSVVPASQGNLTVLVSGEKRVFDKLKPLIEKIGKTIFFLETPGLATKMKLINNLVLGLFMAGLGEALAFAEKSGMDKAHALEILAAGAGNSSVLNAKREKLLKEDFSAHFSSSVIYKDIHYLQDLAYSLKKPLLTAALVKELYGMTFQKGMDNLDFSGIYKIFKD